MTQLEYRYTLGDQSWRLDFAKLTVDDYIEMKRVTGYGIAKLATEFDGMDPLALKATLWMARRKSGEDIAWDDPEMTFLVADLRIKPLRDDTVVDSGAGGGKGGEEDRPTKAPRAPRTRSRTSKTK